METRKGSKHIYNQIQKFAEDTIFFIKNGNLKEVKNCLLKMETIFKSSSTEIRDAIAIEYVYSVSILLEIYHYDVKEFFPSTLKLEYDKQIYSPGL